MKKYVEIEPVARVEGHGEIFLEFDGDNLKNVNFSITEGPRFFEVLVRGKYFRHVPSIVTRICAICTVSHKLASIKAIESALKVEVSEQTELFRELIHLGSILESHYLHTYFLALPDFLGMPNAIALYKDHPEEVNRALKLKSLGNDIQELIGGRPIHPEKPVIGGFTQLPSRRQLVELRDHLKENAHHTVEAYRLFASLEYPDEMEMEAPYSALVPSGSGEFGFMGDTIALNERRYPLEEYRKVIREEIIPWSTAKISRTENDSGVMVGSLSRLNIMKGFRHPHVLEAKDIHFPFPSTNILHNNLAQAFECVYAWDRAIEIIDEILSTGIKDERPVKVEPGESHGIGSLEVPRGTLYHEYWIDDEGKITNANIITPTAINNLVIDTDMKELGRKLADRGLSREEIRSKMELIARAYDPCISCATHMVKIREI
ncbi:MAG: Ni/Fe hydrogenase subunit alpha [Thermoplasmata archaeon]|nr:MAG: Ni/Fe hydrogenase subunit alpha [Thermoplasmata archaeon]